MTAWLLKVEALEKHFHLHELGRRVPSTRPISFVLPAGRLHAITGASGAGKTSLLKCIWGSYRASAGQILLRTADGSIRELTRASEQEILALRREDIGFVTQFLRCLPRKSALDVVAEPLWSTGSSLEAARAAAADLLERLAVPAHLWSLPPATFSGGEQQRINLARGLIRPTRLLLLDEPTASLDPTARDRALALLHERKQAGTAMLAVLHDPALVDILADEVIQLQPPSTAPSPACSK